MSKKESLANTITGTGGKDFSLFSLTFMVPRARVMEGRTPLCHHADLGAPGVSGAAILAVSGWPLLHLAAKATWMVALRVTLPRSLCCYAESRFRKAR